MNWKVTLMAALILTGSLAAKVSAQGTTVDLIQRGEKAAKGGHWNEARSLFESVLQREPSNATALYDLGLILAHVGDYEAAIKAERRAIESDKSCTPAYLELAYILSKQSNDAEAEKVLAEALKIDPQNAAAQRSYSAVKLRINEQVASRLNPGTEVEPSSVTNRPGAESEATRALLSRGATAFRQGKLPMAERLYQQALESSPSSVAARSALGVVLGTRGDVSGQLREELKAVTLDPVNAPALANLGWAYLQNGEVDKALTTYQKALQVNPELVEAEMGQGVALFRSGKEEAGIAALKEAVKRSDKPVLRLNLGAVLQAAGRDEEALPYLQEAYRQMPASLDASLRLAAAYLSTGASARAAELYHHLVEKLPQDGDVRVGLGLALVQSKDYSGAERQFKRAVELDERSAAARAGLAMIAEISGDLGEARRQLDLAKQIDPSNDVVRESLSRLAGSKKDGEI